MPADVIGSDPEHQMLDDEGASQEHKQRRGSDI
jgi:hypothetical protein